MVATINELIVPLGVAALDFDRDVAGISQAAEQGSMTFESLLLNCRVRIEMIVTFMALLELIKLGRISVVQTVEFGEIQIVYRPPEGSDAHAAREAPVRD